MLLKILILVASRFIRGRDIHPWPAPVASYSMAGRRLDYSARASRHSDLAHTRHDVALICCGSGRSKMPSTSSLETIEVASPPRNN
jgi:hypothetical protein